MCPSCHEVEGNSAVRQREPAWSRPSGGQWEPAGLPQRASSAVCEKVYGMPARALEIGQVGRRKELYGTFYQWQTV